MNFERRLKAVEDRFREKNLMSASRGDPLMDELTGIADRLKTVPLSQITKSPSVFEILAVVFDGRVDEAVYEKCVEYSKRDGHVGRLFTELLERANAA